MPKIGENKSLKIDKYKSCNFLLEICSNFIEKYINVIETEIFKKRTQIINNILFIFPFLFGFFEKDLNKIKNT